MKKGILKILSAIVAFCAVLPCAVAPVFANSGPAVEYGSSGAGVMVRNENSVLAVESEKLTFDIKDYPQMVSDTGVKYESTVTAEYKFVNTSDETVHTSMAFPAGAVPEYYNSDISLEPTIKVDGEEVETELRYTYGNYYHDTVDFSSIVAEISDEWYSDDFYKPDTPVKTYKVFADRGRYSDIAVYGKVTCDKSKTRYSSGNDYGNEMHFYFYETSASYESLVTSGQYVFYVIGDTDEFDVKWSVAKEIYHPGTLFFGSNIEHRPVDIPVEVTEITNKDGTPRYATLKDLILSKRPQDSIISDVDYYNGIVRAYVRNNDDSEDAYAGDFRHWSCADSSFCVWYLYDVEVEPHGSFTNTVTAPLLPTVNMRYDPYIYEYEYYLSPASKWKDFGELEIRISADYYMLDSSMRFEQTEHGFSAKFESLPEGELTFRLCSVEDPTPWRGRGVPLLAIIIIFAVLGILAFVMATAGVVIAIVYLAKNRKKKKVQ